MTILSDERSARVAHYSLIAESMNSGFTSVPEFPWPIMMMVAALALIVLELRRKPFKS